jgi:hypothetical protein
MQKDIQNIGMVASGNRGNGANVPRTPVYETPRLLRNWMWTLKARAIGPVQDLRLMTIQALEAVAIFRIAPSPADQIKSVVPPTVVFRCRLNILDLLFGLLCSYPNDAA